MSLRRRTNLTPRIKAGGAAAHGSVLVKVMHDGRCKGCKRIVVAETEAALTDAIHRPCPHCGRVKWAAGRPS